MSSGGPKIVYSKPPLQRSNETAPLASVLSDVEENVMNTSTQSFTSQISLEKYNSDADSVVEEDERERDDRDTTDDEDQRKNEEKDTQEEEEEEEEEDEEEEDEAEEEKETEKKWEDDDDDEDEDEDEEKFGTIKPKPYTSNGKLQSDPTLACEDTFYMQMSNKALNAMNDVPISRPFVSRSKKSSQSSLSHSASSQSTDTGRVTRGSAIKRTKADAMVDENDDDVDYFTTKKTTKKRKN